MARRARKSSSLMTLLITAFVPAALIGSCIAPKARPVTTRPATTAVAELPSSPTTNPVVETATAAEPAAPRERTYILNTNTRKFHVPDCAEAARIKEENRSEIQATRDEVLAMGYSPCGKCQ